MIKKIFNWSFGAFFRTIGRIFAYLVIVVLIIIIGAKSGLKLFLMPVKASTVTVSNAKFNLYTALARDEKLCAKPQSYGYKNIDTSVNTTERPYIHHIDYLFDTNLNAGQSYTITFIQSYNPKTDVVARPDAMTYRLEGSTTTSDSGLTANNISSFKCFLTNDKNNAYKVNVTCNVVPLNNIKKIWIQQTHLYCMTKIDYFNTYTLKINQNSATEESINNQTEVIKDSADKIISGQDKIKDSITSTSDDDEDESCGIICKLKSIVKFLKPTSLSNLIVPNEDQMHDLMDTMQTQVTTKLGILGFPISLYTQLIDLVQNVTDSDWCISWDSVTVPNFEDHTIIEAGTYCFSTILQNEKINTFRTSCHLIIGALILLAFVQYLKNCANKVLDIPDREDYIYFTSEDVYSVSDTGEVELKQVRNRSTYREKR